MRDAVVAALTLHIFQDHCDRVQMANLAQLVNVLQALFLTKDDQMILTPTYHVFDMFKGHQDATQLPMTVSAEDYSQEEKTLPAFSASASQADDGQILLTVCNLKPDESITISCEIEGGSCHTAEGVVLASDSITAHNTFDDPQRVTPLPFTGVTFNSDTQTLELVLPPAAVVAVTLS